MLVSAHSATDKQVWSIGQLLSILEEYRHKSQQLRADCAQERQKSQQLRADCVQKRQKSQQLRADCAQKRQKSQQLQSSSNRRFQIISQLPSELEGREQVIKNLPQDPHSLNPFDQSVKSQKLISDIEEQIATIKLLRIHIALYLLLNQSQELKS